MCPLCISTALGITAATVTTGGVAALVAFTRRLAGAAEASIRNESKESEA
jgi:hypothetical protein